MEAKTSELIKKAKKMCLLCYARRHIETEEKERKEVELALKEMIDYYAVLYDDLRAQNAAVEKIKSALNNMRYCKDLLEKCKKCDRTVDTVNRAFVSKI